MVGVEYILESVDCLEGWFADWSVGEMVGLELLPQFSSNLNKPCYIIYNLYNIGMCMTYIL